jgi:hypothetical protein
MTRTAIVVFVLSLSTLEAMSASNCDLALKAAASHPLAPMTQDKVDHSTDDEKCRAFIKQFVEAVTARQAASNCQESVGRQRALEILDRQIQTVNDRLAEQSCSQ